jgi:hypothetical protein
LSVRKSCGIGRADAMKQSGWSESPKVKHIEPIENATEGYTNNEESYSG